MNEFEELNDDNFLIYAIKNYQNPSCTGMAELEDDLKRFKYLKRLLNKYLKTGEPNERLIINHIILLYNVFGQATTRMLFFKLEEKYWSDLKTFLVFLNRLPIESVYSKRLPKNLETDIPINMELAEILRNQ
tara:strand:+ start:512 stop:907 length:396 start_codon:yes stop_codon:yes gene_type:complete